MCIGNINYKIKLKSFFHLFLKLYALMIIATINIASLKLEFVVFVKFFVGRRCDVMHIVFSYDSERTHKIFIPRTHWSFTSKPLSAMCSRVF